MFTPNYLALCIQQALAWRRTQPQKMEEVINDNA